MDFDLDYEFWSKFNLSNIATEVLIKFMKLVLTEISNNAANFEDFPDSIYSTREALGLKDRFQNFVACSKCHKLHNKHEVENFCENENLSVMKCRHVEFSNSATHRLKLCQTPLSRQIRLLNNKINRYEMIYPFAGIQQQLV